MSESTRRVWATPAELVAWLQLDGDGLRKLRKMRQDGTGPDWMPVGRDVRYLWSDVHAWCRAQRAGGSDG